MSDYDKDLERFLEAWDRVQRDMEAQDRLEEVAVRAGVPLDEFKRNLEEMAKIAKRLGKFVSRRELADLVFEAQEVERNRRS